MNKNLTFILVLLIVTALIMTTLLTTAIVCMVVSEDEHDAVESHEFLKESSKMKETEMMFEDSTYYKVTSEERELLAKLVHCEASICNMNCKYAVVSVVFNRLDSGKWGDTLTSVIYYKNAFTPATNGKIDKTTPSKSDYDAVDYVVANGPTVPTYVRYFRTDHDFNWNGYKNYTVIDNVYFGYLDNWQKGAW